MIKILTLDYISVHSFLTASISKSAFELDIILKCAGENALSLISSLPLNAEFRRAGASQTETCAMNMSSGSHVRWSRHPRKPGFSKSFRPEQGVLA